MRQHTLALAGRADAGPRGLDKQHCCAHSRWGAAAKRSLAGGNPPARLHRPQGESLHLAPVPPLPSLRVPVTLTCSQPHHPLHTGPSPALGSPLLSALLVVWPPPQEAFPDRLQLPERLYEISGQPWSCCAANSLLCHHLHGRDRGLPAGRVRAGPPRRLFLQGHSPRPRGKSSVSGHSRACVPVRGQPAELCTAPLARSQPSQGPAHRGRVDE